jgi:zona occludens toxin (predicted ATPase)
MIEIYEGRLGGGKTYSATIRIVEELAKGRQIFTNVTLKWEAVKAYVEKKWGVMLSDEQFVTLEYGQIKRFREFITRDSLVVIDEAHLWFNARDWSQTDRDVLAMLTQSRKIKVDVIFISQSAANIDKQFARLVQYIWRFRDMETFFILPGLRWPFKHIVQAQYDYDGRTRLNRFWKTKDKEIFGLYETNALLSDVGVKEGIGTRKLDKVTKKKKGMKWVVVAVVLGFFVLAGWGIMSVFGLGHTAGNQTASSQGQVHDGKKEVVQDFMGARFVSKSKGGEIYTDRFRIIAGSQVVTDSYVFRRGEISRCGEVLEASAKGVRVKAWDGTVKVIIRDWTPDPPLALELVSEGKALPLTSGGAKDARGWKY